MRLADAASGDSVELNLAGYEFEQANNEYDANWLIIVGHIQHGSLSWTFRQPCMLTSEAQQLADWLELVAANDVLPSLQFLEPNLAFSLDASSEPTAPEASARIRIEFAAEAAPPARRSDGVSATHTVTLQLTKPELADAAAHWRRDLTATAETRQSDEQRHR
ncbi:MAG TPA: hypothetical protein VGP24_07355 [Glaciihabitans sp.]|jgi:hypothetical protein|nr:hypothetical protein [Glaciihabitans sp.]